MKILRVKILAMFKEMGFTTTPKWKKEQLLGKIKNLPNLPEKATDKVVENKDTLAALIDAILNDEEIELTVSKKEDEKKPAKKKPAKKKSAAKKAPTKKKPATKKPAVKKVPAKKKPVEKKLVTKKPEVKAKTARIPTGVKLTAKDHAYVIWLKDNQCDPVETLEAVNKLVDRQVQLGTMRSWISGWRTGVGTTPRSAKKKG